MRPTKSVAAGVLVLLTLAGCAATAAESDVLVQAVSDGTFDPDARSYCDGYIHNLELVAALDSTAAQVREVAGAVETRGSWDEGLPAAPEDYVAICIFDGDSVAGLQEGLKYIAYWGTPSAQQPLATW